MHTLSTHNTKKELWLKCIDGLVQERRNSIANARELCLFGINPSISSQALPGTSLPLNFIWMKWGSGSFGMNEAWNWRLPRFFTEHGMVPSLTMISKLPDPALAASTGNRKYILSVHMTKFLKEMWWGWASWYWNFCFVLAWEGK